jgi:hypothetical protein
MGRFLALATVREPPIDGLAVKGLPCDHPTLRVKVALPGTGKFANLTVNGQTAGLARLAPLCYCRPCTAIA